MNTVLSFLVSPFCKFIEVLSIWNDCPYSCHICSSGIGYYCRHILDTAIDIPTNCNTACRAHCIHAIVRQRFGKIYNKYVVVISFYKIIYVNNIAILVFFV